MVTHEANFKGTLLQGDRSIIDYLEEKENIGLIVICFCCCRSCRECVCITCSKSISAVYNVFTTESCRLRRANNKLRRDNRQKRKILEKNIKEHELIDRALAKLGINITDTFEQNLEEGNVDHLGHQQTEKASSSSAVDTMAIVKEGETSI